MSTSEHQNIRQVSCIYLRKIITNLWLHLNKDQQENTKQLLLQRFIDEPVPLIKKNIADVIGQLGKILIPNKEWNELFQFFFSYSNSEKLIDKELAMVLLSVIIEYFSVDEIRAYYDALNKIIEGYLQSQFPSLKTLAIDTVNKIAQTPKAIKILKKYNNLIPLVLQALSLDQEETIQKVFEMLNDFVEIKKVLAPHLIMLIDAALKISSVKDYSLNLREITLLFLEQIAENYSKYLRKAGSAVIERIIEVGFQIASESEEEYQEGQETPHTLALYMIYSFSCEIPNNVIYPIIMKYVEKYGTSQKELERKAAVKVLGYICDSDSCLDLVKEDIENITKFIVLRLKDQNFIVREACAETVGKFSEFVVPDFLDMHEQVMPCLLQVLKELSHSKNDLTIQKSLFALHEFTNNLHEDVKIYLVDLIQTLLSFVQSPNFSRDVKYWALTALGSVESSAMKLIIPYQNDILKALYEIITGVGQNHDQIVRGQALMCAGQLATAVGKDKFPQECIEVFTKIALQFISEQNKFELRETAISYFAEIARILRGDMAPILDQVVNEVLSSIKSEKGVKHEVETKQKEAFSLDSDSADEEEGGYVGIDVDVNFIDEKASAVHAIGNLCLFCPTQILPRLDEILTVLSDVSFYFHENIRYHVCLSYLQIAVGLLRHFTPESFNSQDKFQWKKGLPVQNPFPEKVQQFLDTVVLPHYFKIFEDESNKEVIEKTLECIREMGEDLGPGSIVNNLDNILKYVVMLLEKRAFCQTKTKDFQGEIDDKEEEGAEFEDDEDNDEGQDEDEDDEDEDIDHDEIILGNTTDVIIALARALGDQFVTHLTKFAPSLVKYLDDSHPKSDKIMVIGCLSETFNNCTAAIPVFFNDFWKIIQKNSNTNDSGLNRNCAYSIGILAQHSGPMFQAHVTDALQALNVMYAQSEEQDAKDNVIAATCRIAQNYSQFVPFDTLIDFIFTNIPLNGDVNENETVLKFYFNLYLLQKEKVEKYMEKAIYTCLKVLIDEKCDEVPESFKIDVGRFIKNCVMTSGEQSLALLRDLESKMNKYLPEVVHFQQEKEKKQRTQRVAQLLSQWATKPSIKKDTNLQHVGTLFNFLDEKNFHNDYDGAYTELGLNQKDLFKSKSTKTLKEPEIVRRYVVIQFLTKPKEGRIDYYGSSMQNSEKETDKQVQSKGSQQQTKKLNSQQSQAATGSQIENDDLLTNDPKMILLYDQDDQTKKKALKLISQEMFAEIIDKISQQNIQKNKPIEASKLSHEQFQNIYQELNQELYLSTKKQFEKVKFNLLKYNINLTKLDDARKQLDLDFTKVQGQSKLYTEYLSDQKYRKQSFLPQIHSNANNTNKIQERISSGDDHNKNKLRQLQRNTNSMYDNNIISPYQNDQSSLSGIKSPVKRQQFQAQQQNDKKSQASDLHLNDHQDLDENYTLTQSNIQENNKLQAKAQMNFKSNTHSLKNLKQAQSQNNNQKMQKEIEQFMTKDFNAEKSEDSTKRNRQIHYVSIEQYIKEMEKRSFYFKHMKEGEKCKNPQLLEFLSQQNIVTQIIQCSFSLQTNFQGQSEFLNKIDRFKAIMKSCDLNRSDIYHFINNYRHFSSLNVINFANNPIKDIPGLVLVQMLKLYAPSLDTLILRNCQVGIETIRGIRDYLMSKTCKLVTLSLAQNELNDLSFCELCVGISQNFSLKALDFSSNKVTYISMKIFQPILKYSRLLQELDLSNNPLSNTGTETIAKNLGRNKSLIMVRLNSIELNDDGAQYIAQILSQNKVMRSLEIANNQITNYGLKLILDSFRQNDNLRHLSIQNNPIDYHASRAIRKTKVKAYHQIEMKLEQDFNLAMVGTYSYLEENDFKD